MPTPPTKGPRLGGGPAHERLMLANLAAALFEHKRITTTVTKPSASSRTQSVWSPSPSVATSLPAAAFSA